MVHISVYDEMMDAQLCPLPCLFDAGKERYRHLSVLGLVPKMDRRNETVILLATDYYKQPRLTTMSTWQQHPDQPYHQRL
jgi:hypothetical protein